MSNEIDDDLADASKFLHFSVTTVTPILKWIDREYFHLDFFSASNSGFYGLLSRLSFGFVDYLEMEI